LFHAIQNRADQMGETDRCRHVGVELSDDPSEIVEMTIRKRERFQLIGRIQASVLDRGHEMHLESSSLGVTGAAKSLP
jgi:hypothetical protein